ncbi:hypothetical protein R1sor_019486 [Riccia sorocarpa]|uniref:Reverse transcriptase zinc-binding domain-containing protein n=1 Tax=Riccia sorocarpa TaxID=122646 RepID=A0ABD3IIV9_9MARC
MTREITEHLTLAQSAHLMLWEENSRLEECLKAIAVLRKIEVVSVRAGKELSTHGESWRSILARQGYFPEEEQMVRIQELEDWLVTRNLVTGELLNCKGWKWRKDDTEVRWAMATKEWVQYLADGKDYTDYLNEKWRRQDSKEDWKNRWSKLWTAPISYRRKAWLWRFLQRGYFLNSRGSGRTEEEKLCTAWGFREETLEHAFWECSRLNRRKVGLKECGAVNRDQPSLMSWLDYALLIAKTDSSALFAAGVFIKTTWTERNNLKFRGALNRKPIKAVLEDIKSEIEALPTTTTSAGSWRATSKALETVKVWMNTWELREQRRQLREEHSRHNAQTERSLLGPTSLKRWGCPRQLKQNTEAGRRIRRMRHRLREFRTKQRLTITLPRFNRADTGCNMEDAEWTRRRRKGEELLKRATLTRQGVFRSRVSMPWSQAKSLLEVAGGEAEPRTDREEDTPQLRSSRVEPAVGGNHTQVDSTVPELKSTEGTSTEVAQLLVTALENAGG